MIKLLVLDVDGCLTNGQIIYTNSGDELKAFNVKDGLAIKSAQKYGIETAIITGRQSKIVERRAKELGITHLFQGQKRKLECLWALTEKLGITLEETAAIGDDLNDLQMLDACGLSAMPADGSALIEPYVKVRLTKNGGEGAVREFIEEIFRREELTDRFVNDWLCD